MPTATAAVSAVSAVPAVPAVPADPAGPDYLSGPPPREITLATPAGPLVVVLRPLRLGRLGPAARAARASAPLLDWLLSGRLADLPDADAAAAGAEGLRLWSVHADDLADLVAVVAAVPREVVAGLEIREFTRLLNAALEANPDFLVQVLPVLPATGAAALRQALAGTAAAAAATAGTSSPTPPTGPAADDVPAPAAPAGPTSSSG